MIEIGSRWRFYTHERQYIGKVVAKELAHVLIEEEGKEDRWGGPLRRWIPAGWLTMEEGMLVKREG